jgi:beta-lactamase class A
MLSGSCVVSRAPAQARAVAGSAAFFTPGSGLHQSAVALLTALGLLLLPIAARAQQAEAPKLAATITVADRAAQLAAVLRGDIAYTEYFTPEFLAAVPAAQLDAVNASLKAQYGAPTALLRIEPRDASSATVFVSFAKGTGQFQMTVDPAQNGRVAGLLVTGFESSGDSADAVLGEIKALPGTANLLVAELGGAESRAIHAYNADTALAIGSTFKLYILAELAEQARRRKLDWDNVSTLTRRSFSSKASENWPADGPVTLHTLASWMISVSDNGATDTLIDVLGRDAVGRRLMAIGSSAAARTLPFLNTVEAFALKAESNAALRSQYLAADEKAQRKLLDSAADKLTLDAIQGEMFVGKPLHIDSIEWFANGHDLVRLLDHLRTKAGPVAHGVMAINPGLTRDAAQRWAYVGYKGGSESGVISMSYLLNSKSGRWYALTGGWNNPAAPVDNAKFAALMQRMADVLARGEAVPKE